MGEESESGEIMLWHQVQSFKAKARGEERTASMIIPHIISILFFVWTIVGYRSNFCPRHHLLDRRFIRLRDALRGFNISVGIPTHALDSSGKPNEDYIAVDAFEEISKRAGFNWTYGVVTPPQKKIPEAIPKPLICQEPRKNQENGPMRPPPPRSL